MKQATGVSANLRSRFLQRMQATERFWGMLGSDPMFVEKDFHAKIFHESHDFPDSLTSTYARPDELEEWPELGKPFYYVNVFKPKSVFIEKWIDVLKKYKTEKIGVLPVN